ncbi:MAG: ABC transporter substrate-binding protein [Oscillospiraceae bacterium]|nr:ABC transporter substrate-binding protein [Oscillospiraceae bacterium]
MKKLLALMLSMVMVLGLAAGCSSDEDNEGNGGVQGEAPPPPVEVKAEEVEEGSLEGNLVVWSFTDEVEVMTVAFKDAQPNVNISYVMTPDREDQFKTSLLNAIMGGNVPDVVSLESAFVREFVENGSLMNLSSLKPLSDAIEAYDFMVDIGTSPDGAIRAYTYQVTPGGVFYRRSIADEVWGDDSPEFVQSKLSNMDNFLAAAQELKAHSPNIYMVASVNEFYNPTYNLRNQAWITDGKLVIDPKVEGLFELAKTFRDEDLEARAGQWSNEWFSSMRSELTDPAGNEMKIFTYFLPTWGLPYVIMPNATSTGGDWGLVHGPFNYSWGGTWIGAMNDATNPENAVEFVKFAALNEDNLRNWATGIYTNEYLRGIDPTLPAVRVSVNDDGEEEEEPGISQGPGDVVNSKRLVAELEEFFDTAATSVFLGGQNNYTMFGAIAGNVQLKWTQASDGTIQDFFGDAVGNYISGDRTREESLEDFRNDVRNVLPDLDWS